MLYRTVANGAPVNQVGLGTTRFVLVVELLLRKPKRAPINALYLKILSPNAAGSWRLAVSLSLRNFGMYMGTI